jgi:hypothetical protein
MIVWTHNTLAVKLWQFMDRGKGTLTALFGGEIAVIGEEPYLQNLTVLNLQGQGR